MPVIVPTMCFFAKMSLPTTDVKGEQQHPLLLSAICMHSFARKAAVSAHLAHPAEAARLGAVRAPSAAHGPCVSVRRGKAQKRGRGHSGARCLARHRHVGTVVSSQTSREAVAASK